MSAGIPADTASVNARTVPKRSRPRVRPSPVFVPSDRRQLVLPVATTVFAGRHGVIIRYGGAVDYRPTSQATEAETYGRQDTENGSREGWDERAFSAQVGEWPPAVGDSAYVSSLRGVFAAEPQWLFDHPDSTRGFYVWSGGMVSGKRSPRRTARLAVVGAVSECNTDRTAINQTSRSTFRVWMRCVGGHRLWLLPSWPMAILAVRPLQGFEVGIGNAWTQSGNLARPYRTERRAIRTRRHVPRRPHGDTSLWAC